MSDLIQSFAEQVPDNLRKDVERALINGWRMNEVKAQKQAKELGQFGHRNEAKTIDGIGRMVARIPPDAFYYWAHVLGPQCWEDKQFIKEFIRDNPEVAVKNYQKKAIASGAIFDGNGHLI